MVEREDEDKLEMLLKKAREEIYNFALKQEESVLGGRAEIDTHGSKIAKLKKTAKEYEKKGVEIDKKIAKKANEVEKFLKKVDELSTREAALIKETENLEEKYNEVFDAISEETRELDSKEKQNEKEMKEAKYGNSYYEKILGLKISGESGNLRFSLTNIDPDNSRRIFEVSLTIKQNQFEAVECNPKVKNLDQLIEGLNAGPRSFKVFLVNLRKSFKDTCKNS